MKRIFFIGAGATKADYPSAPLLNDLMSEILSKNDVSIKKISNIKKFISDYFFKVDLSKNKNLPSIQDVLSFIDIALQEDGYFKYNKKELIEIRNDITYIMSKLLEEKLKKTEQSTNSLFVKKLTNNDAVLTTNYDIVLDNCFFSRYNNINYGVRGRFAIDSDSLDPKGRITPAQYLCDFDSEIVPLLKLHGSLNWLYCDRCDEFDVTLFKKGSIQCMDASVRCINKMCTDNYQSLVVSPSFIKNYKNRIIKKVWDAAEKRISEAEQIIFIGYSMPEDDYAIKSMILRGMADHSYRHGKNQKAKVIVIDKEPKNNKDQESNEIQKKRFQRIFGLIDYQEDGFNKYVESL